MDRASRQMLCGVGVVAIAASAGGCRSGKTDPARASPWDFVVVPAADVRADWRTLPVRAEPSGLVTLAVQRRFLTDADTDEQADLGPFRLRWLATGYHSAPRQHVDPRICEPAWCDETTLPIWAGAGDIYTRVSALRFEPATQTWIVSVRRATPGEELGIAFRRVAHVK